MSVESGFDSLQSEVDASIEAVREARRRRDVFRSALPNAEDVDEVRPSGSLARGTHKDPIHDVDLVAVFDQDAHPDWGSDGSSAAEALEHTRGLVQDLLGSDGDYGEEVRLTRLQNHAVKCFLDDPEAERAFTVDVTPAIVRNEGGFLIPERRSARWIASDPGYLIQVVAERHATWNQFAKLVRVVKRWNADHGTLMKSLVVEVLAVDHLKEADRPEALSRFFTSAANAVWQPVTDPAELCGEIQPDLDRSKANEVLAEAADKAWRAVDAAGRGDSTRAMCLWREIFGDIFPEPSGGCDGGAGAAAAPIVIPTRRKVVDAPQG
jgi:Second Messenger Oligonucleotide or Dinucleotide Synthetase domain